MLPCLDLALKPEKSVYSVPISSGLTLFGLSVGCQTCDRTAVKTHAGGHDGEEAHSPGGTSNGGAEALSMRGGSAHGSVGSQLATVGAPPTMAATKLQASGSHGNLSTSLKAMMPTPSHTNLFSALGGLGTGDESKVHMSFLSKLEALASSSVRVAEKAAAKLIIVFTDTGLTAALVAKYRCEMLEVMCVHAHGAKPDVCAGIFLSKCSLLLCERRLPVFGAACMSCPLNYARLENRSIALHL